MRYNKLLCVVLSFLMISLSMFNVIAIEENSEPDQTASIAQTKFQQDKPAIVKYITENYGESFGIEAEKSLRLYDLEPDIPADRAYFGEYKGFNVYYVCSDMAEKPFCHSIVGNFGFITMYTEKICDPLSVFFVKGNTVYTFREAYYNRTITDLDTVLTMIDKGGTIVIDTCGTISPTPPPLLKITSLTVSPSKIALDVGKTKVLTTAIKPDNAQIKTVKWSTNNRRVADVDSNGKVTAKSKGTAIITADTMDSSDISARCVVTVKQPVKKISLNINRKTINVGKKLKIKATIYPSTASNKNVKWTSGNKKVAVVNKYGVVTAKSKGSTVVTAAATDGSRATAKCVISVKQPVTKVKLNITSKTLKIKQKCKIKAYVYPGNANNRYVRWTTNNKKVAYVTNARTVSSVYNTVKAKGKGTATIKATAMDGSKKFANCKIIVKK